MTSKTMTITKLVSVLFVSFAFVSDAMATLNSAETVVDVATALRATSRPKTLKAMASLQSSAATSCQQTNICATGDIEVYRREGQSIYLYFDVPNFAKRILSATVSLDAYDVDYPCATEHDKVYFNGNEVGQLVGGNQIWNGNTFSIPVDAIQSGQNTMRIHVDVDVLGWVTMVRTVSLNLTFEKTESYPSNVRAWQREKSNLVDIYYDLDVPSGETATISMSVFSQPNMPTATTVYGDVGSDICAGTDKHIVWDAGKDWPDQEGKVMATVSGSDSSASDWFNVKTERFGVNDARCAYFNGELGKNDYPQTFLSGIDLTISVTLTGGTESRPVSYYLLNGSRIEDGNRFQFNVGLLRPGEHLQVVAVDAEGEKSDPFVLNFNMASIPVLWPLHANEDPSRRRVLYTSLDFNTITFGGGLEEVLGLFDEDLEFGFFPSFDVAYSVDSRNGEYRESGDAGISIADESQVPLSDLMKKKMGRFAGADIIVSFSGSRVRSWDAQRQTWVDKSNEYATKLSADVQPINVRIPQTLYLAYFKMSFLFSGEIVYRNEMGVWKAPDINCDPLVSIRPSLGVGVEGLVSGEVFGQLGVIMNATIPGDPEWIRDLGVEGKVGVKGTVLGWESEQYYPWSMWAIGGPAATANAHLMMAGSSNQMNDNGDFHLVRRDYLTADSPTPRRTLLMAAPTQGADNPSVLIKNGYPNPAPAIVADGVRDCLVYLSDDAKRTAVNRTVLMFRDGISNDWNDAVAVWNDGTADFMPSLAKASSHAIFAAWVNGNAILDESATMSDQIKSLEIAVGVQDPETGAWTCQNLTDDQVVDMLPRVKTADNGKAVVVWIRNSSNQLIGTKDAPSSLMASFYDGSNWSQPVAAAADIGAITSFDVAYDGSNCIVTFAKDSDGDVSSLEDTEIQLVRGNAATWNQPIAITSDTVSDERPSLWSDADALNVAWIHGGKLVIGKLADDGLSVLETNLLESVSPSADYKVVPNENSALFVWSNPAEDGRLVTDLVCAEFDSATRSVGPVSPLLSTESVERNFSGAFGTDGAFRMAYEAVAVSTNAAGEVQYGAVDLNVFRREACVDVGIVNGGCSFANGEPSYDGTDEVIVMVQNLGSVSVSGVCVRVYAGAGESREDITINNPEVSIRPFSTTEVTVQCSVSPTLSNLVFTVVADPDEQLPDTDRSNNVVEWRPTVATYGLSFESATADRIATNRWIISTKVSNIGKATVPAGTPIRFWRGSVGGELLGERILGALLADGGQSGVSIEWGFGTANPTSAHETVWIEYGGDGFCPPAMVDLATSFDSDGDGVADAENELVATVPGWVETDDTIGMKGGETWLIAEWTAEEGATNLIHTFSFENLELEDWIEDYTIEVYQIVDWERQTERIYCEDGMIYEWEYWNPIYSQYETITKEQIENGEILVFNQTNDVPVTVQINVQVAKNAERRIARTADFLLDDVVTNAQNAASERRIRWDLKLTQSMTGYSWIKNNDGGITVTGISDLWDVIDWDDRTLIIPESISGLPVMCIGTNAFAGCTSVYSVEVPKCVTNIGYAAFTGCSSITNMVLPFVGAHRGGPFSENSSFGYIFGSTAYNGGVLIRQYGNSTSSYVQRYVPQSLETVTVADDNDIMQYAFLNCTNLTSVTISNSVLSIGMGVFNGCARLRSLILPFVGNERGGGAPGLIALFGKCGDSESSKYYTVGKFWNDGGQMAPKALKRVVVNADSDLRDSAFYGWRLIKEIIVNGDIVEIPNSCFMSCMSLESFKIPRTVKIIGPGSFRYCTNLQAIELPIGLTSIGEGAFASYSGNESRLKTIFIPNTVTNIGDSAFSSCTNLASVVISEGGSDINIGNSAFSGCTCLETIVIPEGVTNIGSSAFANNKLLSNLTIADGVRTIGTSAFRGCFSLTAVSIPPSVSKLGCYSFYQCDALEDVAVLAKDVEWCECVFSSCPSLSSAAISSQMIGTNAFSGCAMLSDLRFSEGVKVIGRRAFVGCVSLRSFTLPSSLIKIEDYAFSGCQGLRAVSFPQNLKQIESCAFNNCTALSTISFPNGVEEIGSGAFSGCAIKSLLFNNENGALLGEFPKDSLKTLFVGESAAGIDGEMLSDCTTLETIMVAKANTDYSVDAYGALYDKGKTKLIKYPCAAAHTSFTAPSTLTTVDDGVFSYCNALTEVTFPSSVKAIGDNAFDWCLGLQTVNFNGTVGSIGDGAFGVCPSLESLYFAGNSPTWGSGQFWYATPMVYAEKGTTGWSTAADNVGFVVAYIGGTEVTVPNSWIDKYPSFLAAAGGDYETAANSVGANGVTLRESYVAGLDPTDENSKFTAILTIENGEPKITWSPDLSKDATPRTYTTYGKKSLDAKEEWEVVTDENKSLMHFFQVKVDLE